MAMATVKGLITFMTSTVKAKATDVATTPSRISHSQSEFEGIALSQPPNTDIHRAKPPHAAANSNLDTVNDGACSPQMLLSVPKRAAQNALTSANNMP